MSNPTDIQKALDQAIQAENKAEEIVDDITRLADLLHTEPGGEAERFYIYRDGLLMAAVKVSDYPANVGYSLLPDEHTTPTED